MADDAGALLVRSGLVSASALDEARARAVEEGGTLGEQLVATGLVADEALTDFYKSRLLVPQVNPNTLARLPAKVVAVIPSDMAIELRAIPVSLDKDNNLTVAMGDPSDRHAVDEIAFFTSAYVVRAVATQMQIAWCLAHYYGHVTALGQRLLQPTAGGSARALAAAVRPGPRTRGHTGKIEAMRHRAIVPGETKTVEAAPAPAPEPAPAPAPPEPPATPPPPAPAAAEAKPEPEPAPAPEATPAPQRARSVSGEIRVPKLRAQSIKPPLPEDEDDVEVSGPIISIEVTSETSGRVPTGDELTLPSGPIISIEVDDSDADRSEEPTDRSRPAPPRRTRPAEPDPPELAARAGEVQLKSGPTLAVSAEEPRIIIADELDEAQAIAESRKTTARLAQKEPEAEPDLPDVAGELVVRTARPTHDRPITPAITVQVADDEPSSAVVIHEQPLEKSEPVLLDRRRESDAPTRVVVPIDPEAVPEEADDEVLELPQKRPPTTRPRGDRRTQLGVGVIAALTRSDGSIGPELDDQPTGSRTAAPVDNDPTKLDTIAAPEGDHTTSEEILAAPPSPVTDDDTSPVTIPPPLPTASPVPPPSGKISLDNVRARAASEDDDDEDDDGLPPGPATTVMAAVDPLDDGWGPPGTTIPPPLLGAMPGAIDPPSGVIPLPNMDSAPLIMAPPLAPEVSRPEVSSQSLARALEDTTARVLDLIRELERADDRDEVVALMISHLGRTHRRAGFFAVRAGELSLFAVNPRPAAVSSASLRLDRPSTLQDVVGTRLPYRGPMHDDASRTFLAAVLGASPPEILLVPVAVRERVVGILFGEHRTAHSFEDQLAVAARAAGIALERILKARRG